MSSDRFIVEPARFVAWAVAPEGQPALNTAFLYVATNMRTQWSAAPHATEIPHVFNTVRARDGTELTPEDATVARPSVPIG